MNNKNRTQYFFLILHLEILTPKHTYSFFKVYLTAKTKDFLKPWKPFWFLIHKAITSKDEEVLEDTTEDEELDKDIDESLDKIDTPTALADDKSKVFSNLV